MVFTGKLDKNHEKIKVKSSSNIFKIKRKRGKIVK